MAELQAAGMLTVPSGRRQQSEEYWRGQVEAWRASGLKQNEFCRRGQVSCHGFRHWKVKLDAEGEGGDAEGAKLVAIKVPRGAWGAGRYGFGWVEATSWRCPRDSTEACYAR